MKKLLVLSMTTLATLAFVSPAANADNLPHHFFNGAVTVGVHNASGAPSLANYGFLGELNYRVSHHHALYLGGELYANYGNKDSVDFYNVGAEVKTKYFFEGSSAFTPYVGAGLGYGNFKLEANGVSVSVSGVSYSLQAGALYNNFLDFGLKVRNTHGSKNTSVGKASGTTTTTSVYFGLKF
ncbi:hypothetical protein CKF54_04785 [Psittacicella hinzii]|uniref:Outer membrane protein beta-barrel domain-containing protein n=1 Tax=Psittacicella hinzii TaxID=2028575 RepID=A0A3A1Y4Y2_9GAMM|nr:OmpW family outer membrane protein [Psittacicella hinzii]RIY32440.1 hypothetical protein CKF54_04785 [Psittacicella hinzii]